MAKPGLLILDDFHPLLMQELDKLPLAIDDYSNSSKEEILALLNANKYDGILVRSKLYFDTTIIQKLKSPSAIFRGGAGMDNIDTEACKTRDITCFNSENANSNAVAEHALGLLLSLSSNIHIAATEVQKEQWNREKNRGFEIKNKTIGIIGFGNTGSALAKLLSGFGMQILAYDKYKSGFGNHFVKEVQMAEIFENADIISLHIPLTTETKYLVNEFFLERFTKRIVLLNTSRGEIINTWQVLQKLQSGKLVAFGTDVLEHENFETMPMDYKSLLQELQNKHHTVITPHVAGWTKESHAAIAEKMLEKIKEYFHLENRNESKIKTKNESYITTISSEKS